MQVARNGPAVAFLAKRLGIVRGAIAVNDQAGIAGEHGRRVQRVRERP
jgi:hypothetical protein